MVSDIGHVLGAEWRPKRWTGLQVSPGGVGLPGLHIAGPQELVDKVSGYTQRAEASRPGLCFPKSLQTAAGR